MKETPTDVKNMTSSGETYPTARLCTISHSVSRGNFRFPCRNDYEQYFLSKGFITSPEALWSNSTLVANVQRHWHSRGQNGCVFAQVAASNSQQVGWKNLVVDGWPGECLREVEMIQAAIQNTISVPEIQLLSLLFPQVVSVDDLVDLIQQCISLLGFSVVEYPYKEYTGIGLRYPLENRTISSWLVGFGPFNWLPFTRQAPITELVFRGKLKPEKMFHRLNQERNKVHLADVPLNIHDSVAEKIWQSTYTKVRLLLGGNDERQDNILATAKVTFSIPTYYWK